MDTMRLRFPQPWDLRLTLLLLSVCFAVSKTRSFAQTHKHTDGAVGICFEAELATLTNSQETWGWKILVLRKNAIKRERVSVCVCAHL